jgi:hypothetical protein
VGYVNKPLPNGFSLVCNPLSAGVSNGVNEVFSSIPDNTVFLTWTGSGYKYTVYDSTLGLNGDGSPWYDADLNESTAPIVTPGKGFFVSPGNIMTNTFVGAVVVNVGATNSVNLPNGFSLVSSAIPYGASITNSAVNFPFTDNTTFLFWTGSGYNYVVYDNSLGLNGDGSPWYDANLNEAAVPSLSVGQGFFVSPGSASVWKQTP